MDPENIAAIAIAGISALSSVLTVVYIKYKSSFGDRQNTNVTLTSEIYNPKTGNILAKKTAEITMSNDENYETESIKFKNGKDDIETTTTRKPSEQLPMMDKFTGVTSNLSEISSLLVEEEPQVKLNMITTSKKDEDSNKGKDTKEETIQMSDLQAVLNNNAKGDAQITEARQYTLFHIGNSWIRAITEDYAFMTLYFNAASDSHQVNLSGVDKEVV